MSTTTTEQIYLDLGTFREKDKMKVRSLQMKLGEKAKREPKFRFYSLYGHIQRGDVLRIAWDRVRANKGSPGIDGVTISSLDKPGAAEALIQEIQQELKDRTYKPKPVKRVLIPKADGKTRPLGIPTVKDRILQMAVVQILQPIFEADFEDCSYGFRPGRSAKDALVRIREEIRSGRDNIYDADLKGYFDSIPHDKLLACVRMRVTDRNLLNLIKLWLRTPIVEYNEDKKKWTQFPPSDRGTPQGGVISPLLANLYLHWFDKAFHMPDGPAFWANARMVRYADDFVIMARYVNQRIMGWVEQKIESWMDLTINKEKSKVVNLRNGETLDFLGYSYRMVSDRFGRKKKYLELAPSKKAVQKEKENLKAIINSSKGFVPLPDLVSQVNRQLVGWKEYFKNGYPRKAFRDVNNFVRQRFASHLRRRSQRRYRPSEGVSFYKTMEKQGLVYL